MKEPMNKKWEIVSSRLAGESILDDEAFDAWLASDFENRALWTEMQALWQKSLDAGLMHAINVDEGWGNVSKVIQAASAKRRLRNYIWSMAASVLLVVGLAISYFMVRQEPTIQWEHFAVTQENSSTLALADGSLVDVNRGSELYYPASFDDDTRRVRLQGEAFFDVRKGVEKPFVVDVGQFSVRVTGTAFNIRNSAGSFEVVVVEGSVVVQNRVAGDDVVNLVAGEVARLDKKNHRLVREINRNNNFMAWKTRRIEFRNSSLEEVCQTVESVYGIRVDLDESLANGGHLLTAAFSHDDLDNVMKVIELTLDVKFEPSGENHYILQPSR